MRRLSLTFVIAFGVWSLAAAPASAIESTRLITGVQAPLYLASPEGDPRLFIVEKTGYIEIFNQDGTYVGQFLDIDARVNSTASERGLFTISFAPDYNTSGHFYLNYTNNSGSTVISRFTTGADPNDADESSEQILLTIAQPFSNHNGGRMLFGPDGYLYIGTGDGGSGGDPGNRAQNLSTLLGKMLRIDVSGGGGYSIPADNPFVGVGGAEDEIWAYGVRNPWGMDFDPADGAFYWADVGQELWEEVNVQPATSTGGENYGWRVMEGDHCYNPPSGCDMSGKTLPTHEYSSSNSSGGNCSVTGGVVYRGSIPEIDGHYFFADYCSRRIWTFEWDGASGINNLINRTTELTPDVGTISTITGICRDAFGEIYFLDQGGEVFKVIGDLVETPDTVPAADGRITVAPNPFQSSARFELGLENAGEAVVTVFDLQGAVVRSWAKGEVTSSLVWDGTDDSGREVSQGVYYIQVQIGDEISRSRVTLVN